ncbi:MAG: methylmalonyl Co-A mutase-associated GTPase MeaB, partial [Paludibacter sp.]
AGFDTIFVETVGVGQSETAVHSMVDFFLLIQLTGAGDELQGIKRGIMEMADGIAINKCDGSNIEKAKVAKAQYQNALHLFPPQESGWTSEAITCSSIDKNGIPEIWNMVERYMEFVKTNRFFEYKRNAQSKYWMYETINEQLKSNFYQNSAIQKILKESEQKVLSNELSSFIAAKKLLDKYFNGEF